MMKCQSCGRTGGDVGLSAGPRMVSGVCPLHIHFEVTSDKEFARHLGGFMERIV